MRYETAVIVVPTVRGSILFGHRPRQYQKVRSLRILRRTPSADRSPETEKDIQTSEKEAYSGRIPKGMVPVLREENKTLSEVDHLPTVQTGESARAVQEESREWIVCKAN